MSLLIPTDNPSSKKLTKFHKSKPNKKLDSTVFEP